MRIGVIGAGIIGATSALALARAGHEVVIFDRKGVAAETSRGNAGAFAFADIIPLATPGILRKAPKWLLDPLGPLSLPPAYALRITPWLLRFWRASWRDRYAAAVAAQVALMQVSQAALADLLRDYHLQDLIRTEGQLQLYEGEAAFAAAMPGLRVRQQHGIAVDLLTAPAAIAAIQPGLVPRFTHAAFTPAWSNVTDPAIWTEAVLIEAQRLRAKLKIAAVTAIAPSDAGVTLATPTGPDRFDRIVLATGAFSTPLLRDMNLRLPLDTERGYNTTLPAGAFDLRTHVTFADHGFVVTRIGDGVRVGGAVELGGMDLPPNMARANALLAKAKRFMPDLVTSGGAQWMGFRPSMPDSLPVIGAHPDDPRIVLAFGHGHLGLTQSAGTARLVADLIAGLPSQIDLTPYRPTRFFGYRA
ncbi:NAD(P)/FAD-dependent oxidoreductase [Ketogulonicigenium vulgare]|uniref:NAD(P)/FAD-dependent oxidoreductase n=1 Tax=Ketogulonicigenium vulgare TaxID=92945 RepID=UPI002358A928|nr:FAD-dependent oxidoreductase [Ketogulonicigenium vulgare]